MISIVIPTNELGRVYSVISSIDGISKLFMPQIFAAVFKVTCQLPKIKKNWQLV